MITTQEIKTIFSDSRSTLHVTSLDQIKHFCEVMSIEYISDSKYDGWLRSCDYDMGIINVGKLNYSPINYYREKDTYTVYEYKDLFGQNTKPKYKVGDTVKIRSDLNSSSEKYYKMYYTDRQNTINLEMEKYKNTIAVISRGAYNQWELKTPEGGQLPGYWTDEMFEGHAQKSNEALATIMKKIVSDTSVDFRQYAITTEEPSTQEERKLIFDFLTDNAENLFSGTAFIKSNDFISYDRSFIYSSSDFKWVYAEPNYAKGIQISVKDFIAKFINKGDEVKEMAQLQIGDIFRNSAGNICVLLDYNRLIDSWTYKQGTRKFATKTITITENWTKTVRYLYTPGESVLIRTDLKHTHKYPNTAGAFLEMAVNKNMLGYIGQVVKITDIVTNPQDEEQYYYTLAGSSDKWSDSMFEGIATPKSLAITSTTGSALALTTTSKLKGQTMPTKTLKDSVVTQFQEVKEAGINAAELKAGQVINAQVIKLVKPKLPVLLRGYAESPVASVVLANVVGLALKQYAPENPKLAKVSNLMLQAAAFDAVDSFNIEGMIDELLSGVKLPAGVSIEE